MHRADMNRLALAALVAVALLALPPAAGAASAPEAFAARSCDISGDQRSLGPTYVLQLSVRRTSCRRGRRVVRAYYRCRIRNGGPRGRCGGVLGYRCSERRLNAIRTQFDAKVRCRKGARRVSHTYTQNT